MRPASWILNGSRFVCCVGRWRLRCNDSGANELPPAIKPSSNLLPDLLNRPIDRCLASACNPGDFFVGGVVSFVHTDCASILLGSREEGRQKTSKKNAMRGMCALETWFQMLRTTNYSPPSDWSIVVVLALRLDPIGQPGKAGRVCRVAGLQRHIGGRAETQKDRFLYSFFPNG